MAFNFISLELLIFVVIILTYTRLRKRSDYSLEMVKNLTIYMPPSANDFLELKG